MLLGLGSLMLCCQPHRTEPPPVAAGAGSKMAGTDRLAAEERAAEVSASTVSAAEVGVQEVSAAEGASPRHQTSLADLCPLGEPVEQDGHRRLALVVGVGTYANPRIMGLPGASGDAQRFYSLLTGTAGFAFPPQNVCLLLNAQATQAHFEQAVSRFLQPRLRSSKDLAILYFAGHGSQSRDLDGDEPDGWDETLLFHDARTGQTRDLTDDALHGLLKTLAQKTPDLTLILDACSSGSAARSLLRARFQPPAETLAETLSTASVSERTLKSPPLGEPGNDGLTDSLPGLISLSAAGDGTSALEDAGHGVFTDALLRVLSENPMPMTWAQVARQLRPLVAARSPQVPYIQGDLDSYVFSRMQHSRPPGWEITRQEGDHIWLSGPALPGWGVGAEVRVYAGSLRGKETSSPTLSRGSFELTRFEGLMAEGLQLGKGAAANGSVKVGDIAVLVRPGENVLRLSVRLRPATEAGGLPPAQAGALRELVKTRPDLASVLSWVSADAAWEVSQDSTGALLLTGPEGRIRQQFRPDEPQALLSNLWQHARQQALLSMAGEGGSAWTDDDTLQVRYVPLPQQPPCARGRWVQADYLREQRIPLCHAVAVEVKLVATSPQPALVGGLMLSSDGEIRGFPSDGSLVRLEPGASHVFWSDAFEAGEPLGVRDQLLVFGTQEDNPVYWQQFTSPAGARDGASALARTLQRWLQPPERRGGRRLTEQQDGIWTLSHLSSVVEAVSRKAPAPAP